MKPYHLLLKFFHQIPKGLVLDIGSGKGRNSFFLAKKGFEVEAIDIDQQSINEIKKPSKKINFLLRQGVLI
jgi:2-polyprenyl-3-methyl-5-hydroxy-6-metoxy-1,4-benzoquinol methylase